MSQGRLGGGQEPENSLILLHYRFSEEAKRKLADLVDFVDKECIPAESLYRAQISTDPVQRCKYVPPIMEELKTKAKKLGLWNLFLSKAHYPECVSIDKEARCTSLISRMQCRH